MYFVITMC